MRCVCVPVGVDGRRSVGWLRVCLVGLERVWIGVGVARCVGSVRCCAFKCGSALPELIPPAGSSSPTLVLPGATRAARRRFAMSRHGLQGGRALFLLLLA